MEERRNWKNAGRKKAIQSTNNNNAYFLASAIHSLSMFQSGVRFKTVLPEVPEGPTKERHFLFDVTLFHVLLSKILLALLLCSQHYLPVLWKAHPGADHRRQIL